MFNSNILDVAIGMIFIYLLLSVMCSAANEMIELMLKKRAIDLERGIRELLAPGSPSGEADIVQQLYDHALINNLFGGRYLESKIKTRWPSWLRVRRTQLPSYIPARSFALALMDLVALPPAAAPAGEAAAAEAPEPPAAQPISGAAGTMVGPSAPASSPQFVVTLPLVNAPPAVPGAPPADPGAPPAPAVPPAGAASPPPPPGHPDNVLTSLRAAIAGNQLLPEVTRRSLITLLDAAGNDAAKARENIENWFNSSMDRVSGWYKRRAQLTILVVGLFVAIAVNVDTITIAKRLSTDRALRESLVAAADEYAKANASPTATPTPEATMTPAASDSNASNAAANPTPTPTPEPTPTPAPLPTPEECATAANSEECKEAKQKQAVEVACADPNSPKCLVATTCTDDPDSIDCKRALALESACEEPNAPKCKYLSNQLQLESLGLPIGWSSPDDPKRKWPGNHWKADGGWWDQLYWHGLGWLLTALAISLGAPFWFDLLNKFIVIRSAVKPHEKSPEESSKD